MKIKSLLAAVSMVAISAGSASALQLNNPAANSTMPLACELDFAAAPVPGLFGFDIQRGTAGMPPPTVPQFNTGVNTIVVTLPGGATFTSDATGTSIQAFTSPGAPLANSTGGVISGGTAGSNSITYSIDLTDNNSTVLRVPPLPVSIGAATPTGALTASVTTASGAATDGAPASNMDTFTPTGALMTPGIFTQCVQALAAQPVDRDDQLPGLTGSDTQVALTAPIFTTLSETPAVNALGTLGTVELVRAPVVPSVSFLNAMGAVAPVPFNFAANVASVSFNVVPDRGTAGIATAILQNGIGGVTLATGVRSATGFAFTVPYVGALSLGGPDAIVVSAFPAGPMAAPILSQNVSVEGYTINLTSTPGATLQSSVPGANGALDALDRVGQTFGAFDWNGSEGTNSVYRITGLPEGNTTGTATFTNDVEGANGVFPFTVTSTNGEAVLTSFTDFGTTNSGYRRADITLNFETAVTGIDVDRLMSRGGVITQFGGGANSDSVNLANELADADQINGSE